MKKIVRLQSFREFFQSGAIGGVILLICVVISLLLANSPSAPAFERFLGTELGVHTERLHLRYTLLVWINDGLMAIFFLLVGLEIKRELVQGELSSLKKAALPIFAALGGVIFPAAIYSLFNHGTPYAGGWGIPMATDIAFAIAVITMLGKSVPSSLKIFLAALAIVDDLMAILVIALFYSTTLQTTYLLYAGLLVALLFLLNRSGVRSLAAYLVPGMLIWYFIHHSGVHATIAGVLTAFTIPARSAGSVSPLEKLEHRLNVPVNYLIMPLFALANTNITLEAGMAGGLGTSLGMGIILGLFIGKPLGITFLSWLMVRLNLAAMPTGAGWSHMAGVGMLGGIGFTMSVFIALLSFPGQQDILAETKFAILTGSLLSGIAGYCWLRFRRKKP